MLFRSGKMNQFRFELIHTCAQTGARLGRLHTPHGVINTPCYILDERVRVVVESCEVVADADFRFTDDAGERAVAQVEVDGEHFFVLQSDDFGKVGCDEALSGAGVEGGQHDDLAAVLEAVDKVVKFGSQDAEGFVDEVARVFFDIDHSIHVCASSLPPVLLLHHCRDFSEERHGHLVKVCSASNGVLTAASVYVYIILVAELTHCI